MAAGMSLRERRRHPRAPERVVVAVTEDGTVLQTHTRNLSASGAYCTVNRFVPPMTKLDLQFELVNGSRHVAIRCSGVVVRIEPAPTTEQARYNVAIFFTELSDRNRSAITRFIRRRLSQAPSTP